MFTYCIERRDGDKPPLMLIPAATMWKPLPSNVNQTPQLLPFHVPGARLSRGWWGSGVWGFAGARLHPVPSLGNQSGDARRCVFSGRFARQQERKSCRGENRGPSGACVLYFVTARLSEGERSREGLESLCLSDMECD